MKGMKAIKGISLLWVLLCLSQSPLSKSSHTLKKQPALGRSVSAKIQGFCRNLSSCLLHPHPGTSCSLCEHRSAWPIWLLHLQDTAAGSICSALTLYHQKQKFGDCWDRGFSTFFKSRFDSKIWGLTWFFKAMGEKKLTDTKPVLGWEKPHGQLCSGITRRGFIPFLCCVFTMDAPVKKWSHHCNTVSRLSTFSLLTSRKNMQRSKLPESICLNIKIPDYCILPKVKYWAVVSLLAIYRERAQKS